MPSTILISLIGGGSTNLDYSTVLSVAEGLPESDQSRATVMVAGRPVEAVPLVSSALDVPSDSFSVREALRGLRLLGFVPENDVDIEDSTLPALPDIVAAESALSIGAQGSADRGSGLVFAPYRDLAKHGGEWVAVASGEVIGADAELGLLRQRIGRAEATVFFVPLSRGAKGS